MLILLLLIVIVKVEPIEVGTIRAEVEKVIKRVITVLI